MNFSIIVVNQINNINMNDSMNDDEGSFVFQLQAYYVNRSLLSTHKLKWNFY